MRSNGFTLVELMVAVLVMALLASAVMLTAGSGGAQASEAAARFAGRIAAARDQAILTGRPVSVWVSASGYGFDSFQAGHWQPMTVKPFRTEDWGKGVRLASGKGERTRVRFDSLGIPDQPLSLGLTADGREAKVVLAANGDVGTK